MNNNTKNILKILILLITALHISCNGQGDVWDNANRNQKILLSIEVKISENSIPKGRAQRIEAIGSFADNTTEDITSIVNWLYDNSNTESEIISIKTGPENEYQISADNEGSASVSASVQEITSEPITITVTEHVLEDIEIEPIEITIPAGREQQYRAIGIYSDTTEDSEEIEITSQVTWNSSNNEYAVINAHGFADTYSEGAENIVIITAVLGEITSNAATINIENIALENMAVEPETADVPVGMTHQYTAYAIYTDDTSADVSTEAAWDVTSDHASISKGLAKAKIGFEGNTVGITAEYQEIISNPATMNITDPVVISIDVSPDIIDLPEGRTLKYEAIGNLSDDTTSDISHLVIWDTTGTYATITASGIAEAQIGASGNSEGITAEYDEIISSPATLNIIDPVIDTIDVSPGIASIPEGRTLQYTAIGNYSDNTSKNITNDASWDSSNLSYVEIDDTGLAATILDSHDQIVFITAEYQGVISNYAVLNITKEVLVSIDIGPKTGASSPAGIPFKFTAIGSFTNNTTDDISTSADWDSSDDSYATINQGWATGTTAGIGKQVLIKAESTPPGYGKITSNEVLFTIEPAELESVDVTPDEIDLPVGLTQQYYLTCNYSDGTKVDLTEDIDLNWSSSSGLITLTNSGLVKADDIGIDIDVTADYKGMSNSTTLDVTACVLMEIAIDTTDDTIPGNVIPKKNSVQFTALGKYSDDSTSDLDPEDIFWDSSVVGVATIDDLGLALGESDGTTDITAIMDAVESNPYTLRVIDKLHVNNCTGSAWVCEPGSDATGDGTVENPFATINRALEVIDTTDDPDLGIDINVAQGEYSQDGSINLHPGVSLKGGYSSDFSLWIPGTYTTSLQDERTTDGTEDIPNSAIQCGENVTNTTKIEGLSIFGGGGDYTAAIFCYDGASPIIQNNIEINGGEGQTSYGIKIKSALNVLIQNNFIRAGNGDITVGIDFSDASADIWNNIILGNDNSQNIGINILRSSCNISNNTINTGKGADRMAGILLNKIDPTLHVVDIINNLIFSEYTISAASIGTQYGIIEATEDSDPNFVRNNNIYHFYSGLYKNYESGTPYIGINADGNFTQNADGSGTSLELPTVSSKNVSLYLNTYFTDLTSDDYSLKTNTPDVIAAGGLDLSSQFTYDISGIEDSRNNITDITDDDAWSMGAYELDEFENLPIDGALIWLKADTYNGDLTDDDSVPVWHDNSGFGLNFRESTANSVKYMSDVLNGQPAISFDEDPYTFDSIDRLNTGEISVFVVGNVDNAVSDDDQRFIRSRYQPGISWNWNIYNDESKCKVSVADINLDFSSDSNYHIISIRWNDDSSYFFGSYDEATDDIAGTDYDFGYNTNGHTNIKIGDTLDGNIAEVIIYDKFLSLSEYLDVMEYIYNKYGIGIPTE